jgi:hypothetical protein
MDPIFTWSAELEAEDVGELSAVVRTVHWRCTAQAGGLDVGVVGVAQLGDPDPLAFVPAPEGVTSAVIRVWVGEDIAASAEVSAAAELGQLLATAPRQRLAAPSTLAVYAHVRSNIVVGRVEWDGETDMAIDGILIRGGSLPEGWAIGWRHGVAGWGPPA